MSSIKSFCQLRGHIKVKQSQKMSAIFSFSKPDVIKKEIVPQSYNFGAPERASSPPLFNFNQTKPDEIKKKIAHPEIGIPSTRNDINREFVHPSKPMRCLCVNSETKKHNCDK